MAEQRSNYWLRHEDAYPYVTPKTPEKPNILRSLSKKALRFVKKVAGIEVIDAA